MEPLVLELGDVWEKHSEGHLICVLTNLGWCTKEYTFERAKLEGKQNYPIGWKNPFAVMGRGVAKQAADRFPGIEWVLGNYHAGMAMKGRPDIVVCENIGLIFFPTKALNPEKPSLSWQNKSDYFTIYNSFTSLIRTCTSPSFPELDKPLIYLPIPGAGNGGLDSAEVMAFLYRVYDACFYSRLGPCDKYVRFITNDKMQAIKISRTHYHFVEEV